MWQEITLKIKFNSKTSDMRKIKKKCTTLHTSILASSWDYGAYHIGDKGSNIRHLALLDSCACAVGKWVYGAYLMNWLNLAYKSIVHQVLNYMDLGTWWFPNCHFQSMTLIFLWLCISFILFIFLITFPIKSDSEFYFKHQKHVWISSLVNETSTL